MSLSSVLLGLTAATSRSSSSDSETEQPLRKQPRTDGAGAAAPTGSGLQPPGDVQSPASAAWMQSGAAAAGACPAAQARSMEGEPLDATASAGLAAAGARPAMRPRGMAAEPSGVPGCAALAGAGACIASQAPSLAGGQSGVTAHAVPGGIESTTLGFQAALMQRVGASSLGGPAQNSGSGIAVGSQASEQPGLGTGHPEGSKGGWESEAGLGSGSEVTNGAESGRGSRGSSQTRSGPAAADRPS